MRLIILITLVALIGICLGSCSTPAVEPTPTTESTDTPIPSDTPAPTETIHLTITPTSVPEPTSTYSPDQAQKLEIINTYLQHILDNKPMEAIKLFTDDVMLDSCNEGVFVGKDEIPIYLESLKDINIVDAETGRPIFSGHLVQLKITFTFEDGNTKPFIYDFGFENGQLSSLLYNPIFGG